MHKTITLPKKSKVGLFLSLIVGLIFTSVGLLFVNGILKGGDCEYFCTLGACVYPQHACTPQELFFWQTGFLLVGILCLLLAGIAYLRSLLK